MRQTAQGQLDYLQKETTMSNPFTDWAVDLALDRAVERANELNIKDDNFIDDLATEEFQKILTEDEFNHGDNDAIKTRTNNT